MVLTIACVAAFVGPRMYLLHRADAELAEAIFGNMDACKTAPVGSWQKASDFPASRAP